MLTGVSRLTRLVRRGRREHCDTWAATTGDEWTQAPARPAKICSTHGGPDSASRLATRWPSIGPALVRSLRYMHRSRSAGSIPL